MNRSLVVLAGLAAATLLQFAAAADRVSTAAGNAPHGGQLVSTCSHCHGQQGEGLAVSRFPRLAGQSAAYLAKQLGDYAAGTRDNAVMVSFAKAMSAQDMADIAAYYASLTAPTVTPDRTDAKLLDAGHKLASVGDTAAGIPACASCHGPDGRGQPPVFPYLAGQHAEYITAQLDAWREGARRNDSDAQMSSLARKLSATDIAAVSAYFAQLPPPKPQR
ncbi:MAG: hypothetical protein JWR07_4208 [Nevskia sp.]|nr:hypothetical protein [Nevskia sp.]